MVSDSDFLGVLLLRFLESGGGELTRPGFGDPIRHSDFDSSGIWIGRGDWGFSVVAIGCSGGGDWVLPEGLTGDFSQWL